MNYFLFGFCLTLISTILWPDIPGVLWVPGLLCLALVTWKRLPVIAGAVCAVIYFSGYMFTLFEVPDKAWVQPMQAEPVAVRGEIISFVAGEGDWIGANIRLIRPEGTVPVTRGMRLSWSNPPEVEVGQVWDFQLKLKSIASVQNQGGFNQQKYFLSRHIIAKGRVKDATLVGYSSTVRQALLDSIVPETRQVPGGGILLALMLGDKQQISDARWQQLRQTGTGHLVAISGLHLSVVSGWVYLIARIMLNWLLPVQGRRNLILALVAASIAAAVYAGLAGFALPTTRALVMLVMVLALMVSTRFASAWERLLYALFVVLLLDPLSPLGAGFWLSFSALAVILLAMTQVDVANKTVWQRTTSFIKQFVLLQLLLSLGLGLVQALLFGALSPYSIVVNLLMVPWFSLVVIPLTLLGGLLGLASQAVGNLLQVMLLPAQWALTPFVALLEWSDSWPLAWLTLSQLQLAGLISLLMAGLIYYYLPRGQSRYSLSLLPLLPAGFFILQSFILKPLQQPWQVHVLDVGQGLAVVVERNGHGVLYDTGAAYGSFTYASRSVLPFLQSRGIRQLDYLIVSHGDNDHSGGADVMRAAFPRALTVSDALPGAKLSCRPNTLSWQGLTLEILGPKAASKGNNGSCVLRISDGGFSLLLPGDIEESGETSLLARYQASGRLASTVLLVPHHGSRTSSSTDFIAAVQPELAIFSAGYGNQYGFPKQDVKQRYLEQGITTLTSGREGQITIEVRPGLEQWQVFRYRTNMSPFWYNGLFEFGATSKGG